MNQLAVSVKELLIEEALEIARETGVPPDKFFVHESNISSAKRRTKPFRKPRAKRKVACKKRKLNKKNQVKSIRRRAK
jgi:hypothetical protein